MRLHNNPLHSQPGLRRGCLIIEIECIGENYSDDDLLLSVLSAYIESGSSITRAGEEEIVWSLVFAEGRVEKQFTRLLFDCRVLEKAKIACNLQPHLWHIFNAMVAIGRITFHILRTASAATGCETLTEKSK